MTRKHKTYARFSVLQRLEHWVLTLSFTVLAVTGLPQRYPLASWSNWLIQEMGGLPTVRIIHRISAIVMVVLFLVHIVEIAYKLFVSRRPFEMLPGIRDLTDLLQSLGHNLGLVRRPPKLPKFNFSEKIEYWALIWGTVLMTITGFMLWNPITTTRFLPGEFIPAAKVAHSAEALLAVLAILIWHVYHVHLKTFNRSMFDGRLTVEEMIEEHAAELERIESGVRLPTAPPEVKRRRERVFMPVAAVAALGTLVGLYFFITYEQTAITTVPPAETAEVFVRATPTRAVIPTLTPSPSPTATSAAAESPRVAGPQPVPVLSHPLAGREQCLLCHDLSGPFPFPENHTDFGPDTCLICHALQDEEPRPGPQPVEHSIENRENCSTCHAEDLVPASHREAGLTDEDCQICHPPARGLTEAATPEVSLTAVEEPQAKDTPPAPEDEGAATGAPQITHTLEGREQCLMCHDLGAAFPFPEDHQSYPPETCLFCHSTGAPGPLPEPVQHTLEGRENCAQCHSSAALLPESHLEADVTSEDCLICHPSAGAAPSAAPTEAGPEATATPEVPAAASPPPTEPAEVESPATEAATPETGPAAETAETVRKTTDGVGDILAAAQAASQVTHPLEGREECLACHDLGAALPFPENHAGLATETCLLCHSTEDERPLPRPVQHPLEGRAYCTMCHFVPELLPESHVGVQLAVEDCVTCHPTDQAAAPGAEAATTVEATVAPTTAPSPTRAPTATPTAVAPTVTPVAAAELPAAEGEAAPGSPPRVSHPLEGREDCLMCHAQTGSVPYPANHTAYAVDTCLFCHPTGQEAGALPQPVQHPLEGRQHCTMCHFVPELLPESHLQADLTTEECLVCHPAEAAASG